MISDKLSEDMKRALKAGAKFELGVIRMLRSELKNAQIAAGKPLTAAEEARVIAAYAKKRIEAKEQCLAGGRVDLAEKEAKEYEIVTSYLPPRLSEEELVRMVRAKVEETGAAGPRDFGKVMKAVMEEAAGRAEGAEVQTVVRKILAE